MRKQKVKTWLKRKASLAFISPPVKNVGTITDKKLRNRETTEQKELFVKPQYKIKKFYKFSADNKLASISSNPSYKIERSQ